MKTLPAGAFELPSTPSLAEIAGLVRKTFWNSWKLAELKERSQARPTAVLRADLLPLSYESIKFKQRRLSDEETAEAHPPKPNGEHFMRRKASYEAHTAWHREIEQNACWSL